MNRYDVQIFLQEHRARLVRCGVVAAALALLLVGWWVWSSRTLSPPSIFDDPVDDIAHFFATEDFNRLPVEERLRLIADFVQRFRTLSQSESAVLSGFMAGLTGRSMEQLRENVRILARDFLKEGADGYLATPPDQRGAFIDHWLLQWSKFSEQAFEGRERAISDEQRLAEIRRMRRREDESARQAAVASRMGERDAVRFLEFWQREIGSTATPREQGQIMRFMNDMREHLGN